MHPVRPGFLVAEDTGNFHAVLGDHSVVQNGDLCLLGNIAVLEFRHLENDIVCLPVPRRTSGIHTGRAETVQRTGLAIRVCKIVVVVLNLHLVESGKEDPGVAPTLAASLDFRRSGPLDV